jgi:ABC-type glycerol-3-phosphate transport system substrate-binding protein
MKVLQKIALLLLILISATTVFAKGKSEEPEEPVEAGTIEEVEEAPAPIVLQFLNYGDVTTPEGQAALKLQEEFMAANPDIILEADVQYDEAYHQKLAALLASGEVPHVLYNWNSGDRLQPLLDAGQALDQKPFVDPDMFKDAAMNGLSQRRTVDRAHRCGCAQRFLRQYRFTGRTGIGPRRDL